MNILTHRVTRAIAGGKAAALADLEAWGLPVPPWFVVAPEAYAACGGMMQDALRREIAHALTALGEGLYAVRSSAVDEDGSDHSFAGQLESYLNVTADDVPDRVADVWRSGFTERVRTYRAGRGLPPDPTPPAVLVQRMIAADCAGVAFSADPVSGRRGSAIVSAVRGLGDKLVSGDVDAETWEVDRDGAAVRTATAEGEGEILTPGFARDVAALARTAEAFFQVPQDIEWAIADKKLWLLQSRAITTLGALADPDGELRVWDNSNIAESYGGVTTPLTFSFASRAYEEVYRQFCRIMRVPEQRILDNAETFRGMLGLIQGRVFYNLVNWHRVLALLPGYTMNRGFMEQMMGVKEPLPDGALPPPVEAGAGAKLKDTFRFIGSLFGLWRNHRTLPKQIRKFYGRLNDALAEKALGRMRPDELARHYRDLEQRLLTRWDAPLVNDFFAMIWHGVLRKVCTKWCGDESLANDLIRDQGGIISAEPARRMKELAALAAPSALLLTALREGSPAEVRLAAGPEFLKALDDYLTKFGDRCLDELKLESSTLHDDPALLYRSIAAIAGAGESRTPPPPSADPEEKVAAALRGHPLRRWLFRKVLRNARERVRDRENLRFERTRLFGRVRRIFVELGRRLYGIGRLDGPRDVFYLELHEALGTCDGTATTADLKSLVTARQAEFTKYQNSPPPPDRFITHGIPSHIPPVATARLTEGGEERKGLGCCPGVVRGKVRVVTDPRGAVLLPGEILVAERTDPGWVMLFPVAVGLLVERGSLLSHSAIVSRELGLPAVVSVTGLTNWLKTGDDVEFDGSTGVIRRLSGE